MTKRNFHNLSEKDQKAYAENVITPQHTPTSEMELRLETIVKNFSSGAAEGK